MSENQSIDPPSPSFQGHFGLRLIWMAAFPVVVLYAMRISKQPEWSLNVHDLVFWCLVAVAIVARAQDAFRYHGRTGTGNPTERRDVIRYAVALVLMATVLWVSGNSVDL